VYIFWSRNSNSLGTDLSAYTFNSLTARAGKIISYLRFMKLCSATPTHFSLSFLRNTVSRFAANFSYLFLRCCVALLFSQRSNIERGAATQRDGKKRFSHFEAAGDFVHGGRCDVTAVFSLEPLTNDYFSFICPNTDPTHLSEPSARGALRRIRTCFPFAPL
jgi:hypothetical protein